MHEISNEKSQTQRECILTITYQVKQYFLKIFIENQSHFYQNLVLIGHMIIIIREMR